MLFFVQGFWTWAIKHGSINASNELIIDQV